MAIRIYFENIKIGQKVELSGERAHYLFKVMRQKNGDGIYLFNAQDGEFACKIVEISKNICVVLVENLVKMHEASKKIICVFSVIKLKNVELIIQKCTEIGASEFWPVKTERSQPEELNYARLKAIATEATEQCGRLDVPEIREIIAIKNLEKMQKAGRAFVLLNQDGEKPNEALQNAEEVAIISGPEGGFSQNEIEMLSGFCQKVKISSNILRAETAAILGCGIVII